MNTRALSTFFLAAVLPTMASAQLFHATPLPPLPGMAVCTANGINGAGDVVGTCGPTSGFTDGRAIVWHNGVPTSLGTLAGGTYSSGVAINSFGVVTGTSNVTGSFQPQTFVTTANGLLNADPLGGANVDAVGITDSGIIFADINKSGGGRATDWYVAMLTADPTHPGRYKETALPKSNATTRFPWAFATASNNAGQVIGTIQALGLPQAGGFWNNDSAHTLVALPDFMGSTMSDARGINDLGQITGAAAVQYLVSHAAIFQNDAAHTPIDLGTLPGDSFSAGYAINSAGQVVGISTDGATSRDFFYQNGSMQDLASLIDPADGFFSLGAPRAINNAGQIVVDTTINGQPAALLLTPIAQ